MMIPGSVNPLLLTSAASEIQTGLRFYYSTTLFTSLDEVQQSGTFLASGATIPASQYVYVTWVGVAGGAAEYQLRDDLGVSVSGVSSPYLIIGATKYPTTGSYGNSEFPRIYFSDTNAYYVWKLNPSGGRWGVFSTNSDNVPDAGWGSGGSITYNEGGLG